VALDLVMYALDSLCCLLLNKENRMHHFLCRGWGFPILKRKKETFSQFEDLEELCLLKSQAIEGRNNDSWSYIWGSTIFTTKHAYKALIVHEIAPPHFNWIWKSSCQGRHKFFFWMLLHDRLNTSNLLGRKQFIIQSYNCATLSCSQERKRFIIYS
jgi:hypothetical protein